MAGPALWLDAHAYGVRILAGGREPWANPSELGLFYRQLQDLLRPDILELPLAPAFILDLTEFASQADDVEMADAFDRTVANGRVAALIDQGLHAITGANPSLPLAVGLPGPAALLSLVSAGAIATAGKDALDIAALALSDLIRALSSHKITWLALHEQHSHALTYGQGIVNVTRHYGWHLALMDKETPADAASYTAYDLVFPPAGGVTEGKGGCAMFDITVWQDSSEFVIPFTATWLRAEVLSTAQPETVLATLKRLRG